ncbi:MAG TPA: thermonuclease family protein [Xanthomonadales bacterium]|nr:thermonuclease family protein [Xanthomonadales bacterium]
MRFISIVVLSLLGFAAHGATLAGRVVAVADGDSVTVLDAAKERHKVRLAAIDAPEKGQAFGNRSKQHLSELVFQKEVSVQWRKRDRYGRIVGKVMVQSPDCPSCPKNLDVGQAQLSVGLAWWYRQHAGEQSPDDRGRYESEESEARARRVGLWRDAAPVPPWDFRRAKGG